MLLGWRICPNITEKAARTQYYRQGCPSCWNRWTHSWFRYPTCLHLGIMFMNVLIRGAWHWIAFASYKCIHYIHHWNLIIVLACMQTIMPCMFITLNNNIYIGHGPFSHMFEYGVYEQLKLEYPKYFQKVYNIAIHKLLNLQVH